MIVTAKHCLLPLLLLASLGCGDGSLVSVSGKITFDGKPVEDVLVVFTPRAEGDNHFPGPTSMGITDASGNYYLKTKAGASGAVSGSHLVGFNWSDVSSMEIAMVEEEYSAAKIAGQSEESLAEIKTRLDALKAKSSARPAGIGGINRTFDVPAQGTQAADFELSE